MGISDERLAGSEHCFHSGVDRWRISFRIRALDGGPRNVSRRTATSYWTALFPLVVYAAEHTRPDASANPMNTKPQRTDRNPEIRRHASPPVDLLALVRSVVSQDESPALGRQLREARFDAAVEALDLHGFVRGASRSQRFRVGLTLAPPMLSDLEQQKASDAERVREHVADVLALVNSPRHPGQHLIRVGLGRGTPFTDEEIYQLAPQQLVTLAGAFPVRVESSEEPVEGFARQDPSSLSVSQCIGSHTRLLVAVNPSALVRTLRETFRCMADAKCNSDGTGRRRASDVDQTARIVLLEVQECGHSVDSVILYLRGCVTAFTLRSPHHV